MARFAFESTLTDQQGHVVSGGTATVSLTGTSTAATIYEASTGAAKSNSILTSGSDGTYKFFIDDGDYAGTQKFRIVLSATGFTTRTIDDIVILSADASVALSNLAAVAINTSLVSDTADTDDLGTEAIPWKKLYLGSGGISFEGATDNDYQTTLVSADTASSDKTLTLPDATDTLVGKATTDTFTNKTHTSAILNTGVSGTAVLDEDAMDSDSATQLATQQSIKAYSDSLTPIGKHTIFVPVNAMRATSSNGCAAITDVETTSGRPDMQVLDFDASSDEHAQFQVAMPKSWNLGTITFQAFWTSTATDTDGVAWGLQGVATSNDDTIDVVYGTAVVVTDDNISAAEDMLVTSESSAITIAGTPADDDMCFFRVFRDVSDANDDMTEDARLIGIKLFITTDTGEDT
tara:strand:+ start:3743 stop:4960 length:1218 start_codon:yes stop_codon:yes gene_type:complete